MRITKISVLLIIMAVGVVGLADHQAEACSPHRSHQVGSIHIAWIACEESDDEVVIIMNGAPIERDLSNYVITSSSGDRFEFEKRTVNANCCQIGAYDVLRIHSGPRNGSFFDDVRDLHWLREDGQPVTNTIWNDDGDVAQLFDFRGDLIDVYEY